MLSAGGRLGVLTWLAAPLLFAASVLALTALGGLLIDADWHVTLSIALFGPAAAVTLVIGAGLDWMAAWARWTIRIVYPASLFALGLILDRVTVPAPIAIAVGSPALITLVVLCIRDRQRQRRPTHARREEVVGSRFSPRTPFGGPGAQPAGRGLGAAPPDDTTSETGERSPRAGLAHERVGRANPQPLPGISRR